MSEPQPPPQEEPSEEQQELERERWELVAHIDAATEKPLIALAFVWLGLLIIDLTVGLARPLLVLHYVIWGLFILDFLMGVLIAPSRLAYLRTNWLTAISLMLPALRVLRVVRLFRTLRAVRLLRLGRVARPMGLARVLTSLNRSMRALSATLGRRGLGYAIAMTILVTFSGAAGMAYFENPQALRQAGHAEQVEQGAGLHGYADALWWTGMIMTTLGSQYWPISVEGRILCWLLSVYALAIFGYITANIAAYFIAPAPPRDAEE